MPKEVKDRYEERARAIALDSLNKKMSEASDAAAHGNDPRSMSPHASSYTPATGTLMTLHTTCIMCLTCYLLVMAQGRF